MVICKSFVFFITITAVVSVTNLASDVAEADVATGRAGLISPVCEILARQAQVNGLEKLGFEIGEVSAICRPFVKLSRRELDRCGDVGKDPYSSSSLQTARANSVAPERANSAASVPGHAAAVSPSGRSSTAAGSSSKFTWASRNDMARKGKVNVLADPDWRGRVPAIMKHLADLKESAGALCCGSGADAKSCRTEFDKVEISLCQPSQDPSAPDPCVFGGSYKMPGEGYNSIFRAIHQNYGSGQALEFRRLAERNLSTGELADARAPTGTSSGNIVLSSYISKETGAASLEPVLLHEFGHACSMIKMQQAALAGVPGTGSATLPATSSNVTKKAFRAAQWLDSARNRCRADFELPEAYFDFWESLGESRSLAQCLMNLTQANQHQKVDHACPNLCPGHYLEESVGIAFSLLAGDVSGLPSSVFPNTCDHVRDGQHPMVSDVADCLMQNSPRFREKLRVAYACNY